MNRKLKVALIWCLLIGVVILVLLNRQDRDAPEATITADMAQQMIDQQQISGFSVHPSGVLIETNEGDSYLVAGPKRSQVVEHLRELHVPFLGTVGAGSNASPDSTAIVMYLLLAAAAIVALIYFLRKMRGGAGSMNNIFDLRKTKARPVATADRARFADIGGNVQAVELVADIVDFLREPVRWTAAGLRVPRGVLLVGPPGTGKTLLARAVAGETQAAFFYTSASEFVEMFVGVGAARVRDTFEKAVAKQPAVIFIDELDAIGRRRGSGAGMMHEERENTLNQLLVLLDGMERHSRLVVIAATNRPDVLDPALLRSGRFDRMLRLEAPTAKERLDILKIHTRDKPLDASVSLERIAAQADNFTGADLEALANAAGLLAVRRTRKNLPGIANADAAKAAADAAKPNAAASVAASANGAPAAVCLTSDDFDRALADMLKTARQFDRLDTMLVESVSQFSEPVGRVAARLTLDSEAILEGEVLWMNAAHIKLRLADGSEPIVAKDACLQIAPLKRADSVPPGDFVPDRWAGRTVDAG